MTDREEASFQDVSDSICPWADPWPQQGLVGWSHSREADGFHSPPQPLPPPRPMFRKKPSPTHGRQQHREAEHTLSPVPDPLYVGKHAAESDGLLCRQERDRASHGELSRKRRRTKFGSVHVPDFLQEPLQESLMTDQTLRPSDARENWKNGPVRVDTTAKFSPDAVMVPSMPTSSWFPSQSLQAYEYTGTQQGAWINGRYQLNSTYPPTPPYTTGHVTPRDSGYISQTSNAQTPEPDRTDVGIGPFVNQSVVVGNQLEQTPLPPYTLWESTLPDELGQFESRFYALESQHEQGQQTVDLGNHIGPSLADLGSSNDQLGSLPRPAHQDVSLVNPVPDETDPNELDFFQRWDLTMNHPVFDSRMDYESLFSELPLDQPASTRVTPTKEWQGLSNTSLHFDPCLPGYDGEGSAELAQVHEPSQMMDTLAQLDFLDSPNRSQRYPSLNLPGRDRFGYRDTAMDSLLIKWRNEGMSYKDIKTKGTFIEAESTLRGRYRTLTKPKEERVRKPPWTTEVESLLWESVRPYASDLYAQIEYGNTRGLMTTARQKGAKVPWKQIAECMELCGTYKYGNATVKKKWLELCEKRAGGEGST